MKELIELIKFLKERKKLFLLPLILAILIVGGALVMTQGTAFAPFLYTLF